MIPKHALDKLNLSVEVIGLSPHAGRKGTVIDRVTIKTTDIDIGKAYKVELAGFLTKPKPIYCYFWGYELELQAVLNIKYKKKKQKRIK